MTCDKGWIEAVSKESTRKEGNEERSFLRTLSPFGWAGCMRARREAEEVNSCESPERLHTRALPLGGGNWAESQQLWGSPGK